MHRWKWLILGCTLALGSCASPGGIPPEETLDVEILLEQAVFIEQTSPEGESMGGAFFPVEWWEDGVEASPEAAGIVQVRRPMRRGGGPGPRRPAPLLNPRPAPESVQYWMRRTVNSKLVEQTRQLYWQRLAEAQALYPNSSGYQNHHGIPMYLGGARNGMTYRLPTAYHKAITLEFRREWEYGRRDKPTSEELMRILMRVYGKYPVPQLVGIVP